MLPEQAQKITDEIFSLYKQYGSEDYIGEKVSQIEHMCQSAELAEMEGYGEDVILAAFFHDIGHLCEHIMSTGQMDGYGVTDHEKIAGIYLREKGFSEKIVVLVENHVEAKRYLTFKTPTYFHQLSIASQYTLSKQGGIMNAEEAAQFETDPLHSLYIKLREWDDKAKVENLTLPSLQKYIDYSIRHLLAQN